MFIQGCYIYSISIAYSFFFFSFFPPFLFLFFWVCSIGAARLYRLILFFSPLSFFSFRCVHSGLLQVDYIIGLFFPPFFWVCSFRAATSIGLFSLQLILLFIYNIVSFHMTYSYRHMRISPPPLIDSCSH